MKRSLAVISVSTLLALGLFVLSLGLASRVAAQVAVTGPAPQSAAMPQAASIVLTHTVGTDPALCALAQSITLTIGGGNVIYCYRVRNTGDVTLTRHTLVDEHGGPILSAFPYDLAPGASVFLTQAVAITTSTTNSATWTAFNPGPVDQVSASAGTQVNVIEAAPAIALQKTVGTDAAVCATEQSVTLPLGDHTVTVCYRVTNTGNVSLTRHSLVDERLGPVLSDFPYTLLPGASVFLTQTMLVTATTVSSATWTAYNPGPLHQVSASDTATVVIEHLLYLPLAPRK